MLGVNSDTVIFVTASLTEIGPTTFLFFEIETGRVREEDECYDHTCETEPRNDVELGGGINVIIQYSGG